VTAGRKEFGSRIDGAHDVRPERRCAVTRQNAERDRLLRFVQAPDGTIVPDLDGRLPGRGVWIGAHRSLVETAIATNAFAKSLREKTRATPDLAARVDELMARRLSETLSLANKAGLVVTGFEKVFAALDKHTVAAVIHGAEAADDGQAKIDRKFNAIQNSKGLTAPIVDILPIAQLSLALGRGSVVHAALTPGRLSARFLEEAERLKRYRSLPADPVGNSPEFLTEG
jgi:predicted RNA-binding protein YlxR (DUF448 family)